MKDAVSFRTRKASIYDKKSNTPFKISRSKFFNFMSCKRCFYLDRVKGLKEPSMPGWALNVAVDELLKNCLLYTSPSPRDLSTSRMPSSA